jgi:hypothetical protein
VGSLCRAAVTAALLTVIAAVTALPALGQQVASGHAGRGGQTSGTGIAVVIDQVSPQYARPGSTVTVTGTVTNRSGAPQQDLSIQLLSSPNPLGSRNAMAGYVAGTLNADTLEGAAVVISGTLQEGATTHWSASFTVAAAGITAFGVYPLAAAVESTFLGQLAFDRTFLPFWPGTSASGLSQRLKIAWTWPLIDKPHQAVCPATLTDNSLATSLATGGRLDTLLAVGSQYASSADLTWAIDPALLSDAKVMSGSYTAGAASDCSDGTKEPASAAAKQWLTTLRTDTSSQQAFITPYADVDVAALTHKGLDADMENAYKQGRSVATNTLNRSFGSAATGATDATAQGMATTTPAEIGWPAGGLADQDVLGNIAANGGIGTVILNSNEMMPQTSQYIDNAVTTFATSSGTNMNVLLADNSLTELLTTAGSASAPGAEFATKQLFLAETAMIAAEAPSLARSVVIAPPRQWNPSNTLATDLLKETTNAPWLTPTNLASLAGSKSAANQVARTPPPSERVSGNELSQSYLSQVKALDTDLMLYQDITSQAGRSTDSLKQAVAAAESSAWRGSTSAQSAGLAMVARVHSYLTSQLRKVTTVSSAPVTLAGSSGTVPVSISNGLNSTVQVRLQATPESGRLKVTKFNNLITLPAGKTKTVRVPVQSAASGSAMIGLSLLTKDNKPLPPVGSTTLSVQSTQYGRALLVIIAAAFGVLVLTAGVRAVRQGLRDEPPGEGGGDGGPDSGSVVPQSEGTDEDDPPEAQDDLAVRGWADYT